MSQGFRRWCLAFFLGLLLAVPIQAKAADDKTSPAPATKAEETKKEEPKKEEAKKEEPKKEEPKKEEPKKEEAKSPAPEAAAAAPATSTTAAATLPPYMTTKSADPDKPMWPDPNGGNAGTWATPAGDGTGDDPAKMTPPENYDRIVHNLFSINMVWAMVTGFLVMFMQAGFAMVETGLCRAKNAAHTMSMNFMIYPLGCIAFWALWLRPRLGQLVQRSALRRVGIRRSGPANAVLNSGMGIGPAYEKDAKGNDDTSKPTGASSTASWAPRASASSAWTT